MQPKTADRADRSRTDPGRSFVDDDRAIEGLPIRLVIALTVGVAALALMLNMLGGIGDVGDTEVTVEVANDDQVIEEGSDAEVSVFVIDEDGNDVSDATVLVSAGSAQLDGVQEAHTGDDNEAIVDLDGHGLRADQDMGTLEIDIVPPSDSNYIDEQPNPEIIITEN